MEFGADCMASSHLPSHSDVHVSVLTGQRIRVSLCVCLQRFADGGDNGGGGSVLVGFVAYCMTSCHLCFHSDVLSSSTRE